MSVVPLSRRRKAELKELASNLGLSEDGVREDIVERIKAHIATSNDSSLRALIRDDSPDGTTTTTTTYSTNPNSGSASGRSSPRKSTTTVVTKETRTSSSSNGGARRSSHSHSHTEDELEEREVRGFMDHMQGELHEARDLAKQLEETLHAKFTTGNTSHGKSTVTTTTTTSSSHTGGSGARKGSTSGSHGVTGKNSSSSTTYLLGGGSGGRRGSKDHHDKEHSSYTRQDSGHSSSHLHDSEHTSSRHHDSEHASSSHRRHGHDDDSETHLLTSRRFRRGDGDDDDHDEEGHHHSKHSHRHGHHGHHHDHSWGSKAVCAVKNHVANVCHYTSKPWKTLQDLGSSSRGFVWLTLLLELGVFLSQAYAHLKNSSDSSCSLGFLTNWPNFLQPFFSYYGTFFLIPTLLSQLFNVDRARTSSSSKSSLTGLLSKHTTSALSYFVFKFALTYFLGHSIGLKSLLGTALPAGAKIWSGCKYISDIFRYVPQALGLATSGAGTMLSLAESIVQSHNHRR
ncbi:hypothetical protein EC991_000143 [Linnemannia zychae]|nr:hypothetical protein EC991_000143 [Linnemannia zychae]